MLETVCLKCINVAQPTRAKRTSVFSQVHETVTFQSKEKGLRRGVHGHTVICIMPVMNEPSAILREEKPPDSTFGCILRCLFMAVRLMRERYGGGGMDIIKAAAVSWRRTNSEGSLELRLSGMQIEKHFITSFFFPSAIFRLRDGTKYLIKPKKKKIKNTQHHVWGAGEEMPSLPDGTEGPSGVCVFAFYILGEVVV